MATKSKNSKPGQVRVGESMSLVLAELNKAIAPITAADIRHATGLPPGNVTPVLIRLADEGLVLVTTHPTGTYVTTGGVVKKQLQYNLTAAGKEWAAQVWAVRARSPRRKYVWAQLPPKVVAPSL